MDSTDKEKPLYALLSSYSSITLAHGAWTGGFVIATFTYLGLSLTIDTSSWGLGSFLVFWGLCFAIIYNYGRLRYYAALVESVIRCEIVEPFLPLNLRTAQNKIDALIEEKARKSLRFYLFPYRFRNSLSVESIIFSWVIAIVPAFLLVFLRFSILTYG
jgi:hypothetical protein